MSKATRREYWRQVFRLAWTLSKEHFAWTIPFISAAVISVLAWLIQGKQAAVDDYLKPGALGLLTLVVIAIPMYIFNLFRAAADIHAEQMTAIGTLEQRSQDKIAALEHRMRELTAVPDPLRISFEPGVAPFEETHGIIDDVDATFLLDTRTKLFRVRVENTSAFDVQNVAVRLSFEPERPRMSSLPLRLMHDHPQEGERYQRTFTLPAFDHKDVDVVQYRNPNTNAYINHTLDGLENALPYGNYNVVITAHGSGVRPQEARFTIDVLPRALLFRKRDG